MLDRAQAIANLIREYRSADRDALLCAIISRWPDASGAEIQRGIELASLRPEGRLVRALEPAKRRSA